LPSHFARSEYIPEVMPQVRKLTLTVPLPDPLYASLRRIKQALRSQGATETLDLSGDRAIEWSWVASRIPTGPGDALDFGCGQGDLGLVAAHRGFTVTGVDLGPVTWPYQHKQIAFLQGDILELPLAASKFDLVLNCSTVEHVGLAGRYGVTQKRADGDLAAMTRMRALMKPGATMLLTVPVGRDAVFSPLHRVYGTERLPRLLEGFNVEHSEYWVKDADNRWTASDERLALAAPPRERLYGLGCFVLRRP
jgi:SAM-dependent methyltransferase